MISWVLSFFRGPRLARRVVELEEAVYSLKRSLEHNVAKRVKAELALEAERENRHRVAVRNPEWLR